ncbi:MAG: hypothetical protein M3438_05685 [Pseudomonadota bacterium]|nr:hypothetical protein [Sphingomonas sp.]MDQ3478634.1 hypothetical protein [Pseudomonadota bacterium]
MAKTAGSTRKKSPASKQVAKKAPGNRSRSRSARGGKSAADTLLKLLESPLVAELLAVGATAALAALAEHRYGSRSGAGAGAKRAIKGAVTAAAGAMGRRIATEFDDIKQETKARAAKAT